MEKTFYQKIRFKYKLSVLNENTLEEIWNLRFSKLNVFLAAFFVAVLYFFLIAFLIIQTPLRGFLPGYADNISLRERVMLDALHVDSLVTVMNKHENYITMLRGVMTGNIPVDTSSTIISLAQENLKIELEKSDIEAAFRADFEEAEKYSVTAGYNDEADMNYFMHYPAKGVISDKFDERNRFFGVSINMQRSNVFATLDGVVIFSGINAYDGLFFMQIQHADDLVSVYKIKQPFLKRVGDTVRAGEILATTGGETNPKLIFELWKKGKPLNPESYIAF